MKNIYDEDFIKRCKEAFPDWEELHIKLDKGSYFVGRYLDDSSSQSISIRTVLQSESLEDLKKEANKLLVKGKLYVEWGNKYMPKFK